MSPVKPNWGGGLELGWNSVTQLDNETWNTIMKDVKVL